MYFVVGMLVECNPTITPRLAFRSIRILAFARLHLQRSESPGLLCIRAFLSC